MDESRGSMLLASVMTVSFGVLLFLGIVTSTLSERVRTEQVVQQSKALQLAHTAVEYALWELNYDNGDYSGWGSTPNTPPGFTTFTYTSADVPGMTVRVEDPTPSAGTITIRGIGNNGGATRTARVTVNRPGGEGPGNGWFNRILYTGDDSIHLRATDGSSIVLDGYDSDLGSYSLQAPLAGSEVIMGSDNTPFRDTNWEAISNNADVGAVILEGDVDVWGTVQVRSPDADDTPGDNQEEPGHAIYAPPDVPTGQVEFFNGGSATVALKTQATEFPSTPLGPAAGDYYDVDSYWIFEPPYNGTYVVCPSDPEAWRQFTHINVESGATLALGCTDADGSYSCATRCLAGDMQSQKVTVATGYQTESPLWDYSLSISGTGQVLVFNPTDIYYYSPGAVGDVVIGGGGIVNHIEKSPGNIDATKLVFFGPLTDTDIDFTTNTDFYGAIYAPKTHVNFGSSDFDFYGSLNVRKITTIGAGQLGIHWDRYLREVYPGDETPSGTTFRPNPGSWTIE